MRSNVIHFSDRMTTVQVRLLSGLLISLLAGSFFWNTAPASVRAQTNQPTPLPTPTSPNISVIVRGGGATLWQGDNSAFLSTLAPGARLTATQRSTDGRWLYVQGDKLSGWVALSEVLVFNTQVLPAQDVAITPVAPTATPAATTPAATPSQSTTVSNTQTAAVAQADQPTAQVTLQGRSLNIRSGPGVNYTIIGAAQPGETFAVQGRNAAGDWVQIGAPELAGNMGWVAAQYVKLSSAVDQLPVTAAVNQEAVGVSAAAAPAPAASASQSASTGLRGKIVFQIEWGGAIYIYDLGSGALRQLTHGFDPSISPNGQEVAFTRTGGEHGIWLINVDGSNERNIFGERHGFFAPKWSPDGQWLLFMRTDSAFDCEICIPDVTRRRAKPWVRVRPRLAKIDKNGNNYLDLATLDTATAPDWNSAGVIYTSEAGIQFATDDGLDNNRRVYFDIRQQHYRDPDWQPGGGRIVFQQRKGGHTDLFTINPDGSGLTALTRPETVLVDELPSNVAAAWSPDGQRLVFLSNRTAEQSAGPWGIWVINADGSNPQRLPIDLPFVYNDVEEQMVDWGP